MRRTARRLSAVVCAKMGAFVERWRVTCADDVISTDSLMARALFRVAEL